MESNSQFGAQVHGYWPPYLFCLIGETWDQVIYPKNAYKSAILKCKSTNRDVIAVVMVDIRAFLSSKAAESSEQGSNQTTKTPTLKRESNDSGSSKSQSSSKWKFVSTWLKDFPWLAYDFEANAVFSQMSQALKKYCTVGLFFVEFSEITNCILNMTTYNACYVV